MQFVRRSKQCFKVIKLYRKYSYITLDDRSTKRKRQRKSEIFCTCTFFSFDQQGLVDDPSGGSDGGEQQSGVMNELEDKDGGSGEKKKVEVA